MLIYMVGRKPRCSSSGYAMIGVDRHIKIQGYWADSRGKSHRIPREAAESHVGVHASESHAGVHASESRGLPRGIPQNPAVSHGNSHTNYRGEPSVESTLGTTVESRGICGGKIPRDFLREVPWREIPRDTRWEPMEPRGIPREHAGSHLASHGMLFTW